jgi:hypothetical protein
MYGKTSIVLARKTTLKGTVIIMDAGRIIGATLILLLGVTCYIVCRLSAERVADETSEDSFSDTFLSAASLICFVGIMVCTAYQTTGIGT